MDSAFYEVKNKLFWFLIMRRIIHFTVIQQFDSFLVNIKKEEAVVQGVNSASIGEIQPGLRSHSRTRFEPESKNPSI